MTNDKEAARRAYRERVRKAMQEADAAFRGEYGDEIKGLLGLSRDEIDAITPGPLDLETYDKLIAVVKEASRANIEQAELVGRIRDLGDIAVRIAKKVPKLATILP